MRLLQMKSGLVMLGGIAIIGTLFNAGCKRTPSCEEAINKAAAKVPQLAAPRTKSEAVAECIMDEWSEAMRSCVAEAHDRPGVLACIDTSGAKRGADKAADSKTDVARATIGKYAFVAYPTWSQAHPAKACPDRIEDLNEYMDDEDTKDPWGRSYRMMCGPNAPAGVRGVAVMSPGPDGREGTADDVTSWDDEAFK